ncbi:unnamed protein product [Trifolium pratense]|uniref:Uncharacterized protein n=1 Tax=Trifolium pratense TaxID=57577 RepID=A0ACB0LQ11_TRIPR|nr:unnamed protein product [Trifolium pratense]
MAYVRFILLSFFLLASFGTFPMKKVEACGYICTTTEECPPGCFCTTDVIGVCIPALYKDAVKIIGKNLICQDDAECKNKEIRNYCVRFPKPNVEYGVCANSISEAENLLFKIFSKSKLTKEEIPTII